MHIATKAVARHKTTAEFLAEPNPLMPHLEVWATPSVGNVGMKQVVCVTRQPADCTVTFVTVNNGKLRTSVRHEIDPLIWKVIDRSAQ